jgi:hypothetical protein
VRSTVFVAHRLTVARVECLRAALGAVPACRLTLLCGEQVNELKSSIKFQLKKVLCMGVAIGNVGMEEKEIYVNTQARLSPRAPRASSTLCLRGVTSATSYAGQHGDAYAHMGCCFFCHLPAASCRFLHMQVPLFRLHAIATGRCGVVGD